MIVALLFDLVVLERGPHEDRNHQFPLLPHHLGQREDRAGAGAFSARGDEDDDGVGGRRGARSRRATPRTPPSPAMRVVPGTEAAGG